MKQECKTCINNDISGCLRADECFDFDQWYIDEGIVERERIEAIDIIKEIYNTLSVKSATQLGENLYNRMERFVEINV